MFLFNILLTEFKIFEKIITETENFLDHFYLLCLQYKLSFFFSSLSNINYNLSKTYTYYLLIIFN